MSPAGSWDSVVEPTRSHERLTDFSSDVPLDPPARELLVVAAGDVELTDLEGNEIIYAAVPAYTRLPGFWTNIGTATTSTDIIVWR